MVKILMMKILFLFFVSIYEGKNEREKERKRERKKERGRGIK